MKYDYLKKSTVKSLRVERLDGGLNNSYDLKAIEDNQLSECKNVWFQKGALQTRMGLSCNPKKAIETEILGYSGENQYKIQNSGFYLNGEYKRIATAESFTDDYLYLCNVFLVGEKGNYEPIGKMSFFRTASEVFYVPINYLFYTGKPQTGGGIFAMVTVQNDYANHEKYYRFYEISADFTEWNRIYSFYIPTLYINGRGNRYEEARSNNKIANMSPKILESQNMLDGRFHAYFTSDGYSNSFRLPFTNLASDSITCRIYYTLVDYVEWQIKSDSMIDTKDFYGEKVKMEVDREKGTVYFSTENGKFAIPLMDMYNENNIKITATKEIENGMSKIIHSTCVLNHKSRIIVSGGENGNEIYATSYENPLYFPQSSVITVGSSDSLVTSLSAQDNKIIALKQNAVYALSLKEGNLINKISLLADNDKLFCEADSFSCYEISKQLGCENPDCTVVLNNNTIFMASDGQIYSLTSVNGDKITCISKCLGENFENFKYADFAFGGNNKYIIFKQNRAFIADMKSAEKPCWYYWDFSNDFKISGGFFYENTLYFLCAGKNSVLSYVASLDGDKDTFLDYDDYGNIVKNDKGFKSEIITKHFTLSRFKKYESVYLSVASKGVISIFVNDKLIADVDLRLRDKEFQNLDYKSVKLMPYISCGSPLYVKLTSNNGIAVGNIEINYV